MEVTIPADATVGTTRLPATDTLIRKEPIEIGGVTYTVEAGIKDGHAFAKVTPANKDLEAAVVEDIEARRGFPWSADSVLGRMSPDPTL